MNTTSYGLEEGWLMVLGNLSIVLLIVCIRYFFIKDKRYSVLFGFLITLCILLDTLMWQFNIETHIIDFKLDNGEQVTVFGVLTFILFGAILFWYPRRSE